MPYWRKVLIVSIYERCDMIWFVNQFEIEAPMFKFFKPRDDVFHKLIGDQSAITLEGLKYLVKYIESHDPEVAEQLSLKEKEAE